MNGTTDQKLDQVYELIRQDHLDEANQLLIPVLLAEPDNADAWWLKANATSDPEEAREALQRVLLINPQHTRARELLDQLTSAYPPVPEAAYSSYEFGEEEDFDNLFGDAPVQPIIPEPPAAPPEMPRIERLSETEGETPAVDFGDLFGEPEAGDEEPDFGEAIEGTGGERPRRSSRRLLLIVTALLAILVVVLVVVLVLPLTAPPPVDQQPTIPSVQIEYVTDEPTASNTVQVALDEAQSAANGQSQLLGGTATALLQQSELGATLVIRVCRPAGTDLSRAMDLAMETAARYGVSVENEIAAVGADLVNCDRSDVLLSATAPIDQAAAFIEGSVSREDFQASWQMAQ